MGRSNEGTRLSRKHTIPLYGINSNFVRHITTNEAFALEKDGAVYLGFEGKKDTTPCYARLLDARREAHVLNPQAAITCSEMEANAGLFGSSRTANMSERKKLEIEHAGRMPEDFVERTHEKVRLWHSLSDDRAVLAR